MTEEDRRALHKRQAAERAVDFVESGTVIGLGTGSTAIWAVRRVAQRLREGSLHDIVAIPTSLWTEEAMRDLGIPLTTLEEHPVIDVTIDGADEVDPDLRLIKGGGGALLHEKIVAQSSRREIIVVDDSKPSGCPRPGSWSPWAERRLFGVTPMGPRSTPTRRISSWTAPSGPSPVPKGWSIACTPGRASLRLACSSECPRT